MRDLLPKVDGIVIAFVLIGGLAWLLAVTGAFRWHA